MSSVTLYLNKSDEDFLRTFEGANLSQKLRKLIETLKERKQ